ncbi:MAG: hypothetical protein V9E90_01440 [Saprospiraceae bacterium]
MCKGKVGCKSCARVGKKNCSIKGISSSMKLGIKNLSVLKPAAAGLAGFAAAKFVNKIPMGSGKSVGDNALIAGIAKIGIAAFAPGIVGNKIPLFKEAMVGVAIAGVTDIARQYFPGVAAFIAAPQIPYGDPYNIKSGIGCSDDKVKQG